MTAYRNSSIAVRISTSDTLSFYLNKQSITVDQHSQILTPAFALSGSAMPPSYSHMSSEELDALLAEMEPEIRSADRDLREIDVLDKRGILGAGKLAGSFLSFCYFFEF